MNKKLKIIIILVLIVFLALAGYFGYKKYFSAQPEAGLPPAETPKASTVLPGYKLYKNSDFGFEIQYPEFWIIGVENIVNVRGENTKGFFFKKPGSDLHFAVLPKDGLSYGLPSNGINEDINISGFPGVQTKYVMPDGRRLLLVHPQVNIFNWDQEIGRLDIESSVENPVGDFAILNKMLNSFKFAK